MNEKTKAQFFDDPVYGPNSPFFWPATKSQAEDFAFYDRSIDCSSTKDFLENYEHAYSGAEHYMEETEYPKEKCVDELHADFQKLYHRIESWSYHTFFVSAVYRIIFHDIFPYQSKLYDIKKSSSFEFLDQMYLSKGLYDEAIKSEFLQSLEEIQQDKETEKVGGKITETTWSNLVWILTDPDSDFLVCQELRGLIKQYNLGDTYPEYYNKKLLSKMKLDEAQLKDFDKLVIASSNKFKELDRVKLKIAYSGVPLGLEGMIINVWAPNFERYIEEKVLMYTYTVQISTELVVVDEDDIEEIYIKKNNLCEGP